MGLGLCSHFDSTAFGGLREGRGYGALLFHSMLEFPETAELANSATSCSIDICLAVVARFWNALVGSLTTFHLGSKEDFAPVLYIQNAQNETGNSKMPPNSKKKLTPFRPTPPLDLPAHAAVVGVQN